MGQPARVADCRSTSIPDVTRSAPPAWPIRRHSIALAPFCATTEKSRGPILAFKHGDRLDLVPGFARWLDRAGRALLDNSDVIVPVPLHSGRLWSRRYNQAAELARRLGKIAGKTVEPTTLRRVRATPSQGAMPSAKARHRNMRGAFQVPEAYRPAIRNRAILLIDDVLTTGATVDACAHVLKRAGAAKVHVLALARVVRPVAGVI
ncbi:MAG: ComF family protein [Rhizomicrobium sp.]